MNFAIQKYTSKDYFLLPEGSNYQLIDGGLVMSPAPSPYHQRIVLKLSSFFFNQIEIGKLGKVFISPIDVYLDEENIYQPDILVVLKENEKIIEEKYIKGAPDLVVEVLSMSNAYYDLRTKKNIYQRYGVKEYWIVDPMEKSIEVYWNTGEGYELKEYASLNKKKGIKSSLLLGFELDLLKIF
ncbi:MAG: Uma2 family endonuclease [Leptonema sp. (in: bacteria)]